MAQLDFSNEFGLHLVDAEADHEIWYDFIFAFRLADNFYSLVDVEKYLLQTLQKVEFVLFSF